jgi:hypothetical protein
MAEREDEKGTPLREWIYVYVGEGTTRHIAPHDGQGPTLCGRRGWQVRPLGRYVEDGADCQTCERVADSDRQVPSDG